MYRPRAAGNVREALDAAVKTQVDARRKTCQVIFEALIEL